MADVSSLPVWFKSNGQTWVAATGRTPYFCVVGESEAAVTAIAVRALDFYVGAADKIDEHNKERGTVSPEYVVQKKVLGRDLAA